MLKKVERENGKNGKKDSMIDVLQDDSHVSIDANLPTKEMDW